MALFCVITVRQSTQPKIFFGIVCETTTYTTHRALENVQVGDIHLLGALLHKMLENFRDIP